MSNANDFIIENGVLKKYVGPGGAVIVPEEVTEIGIKAFVSGGYQVSSTITSIQLPRGVTAIRLGAFCGCSNLRSITMHPGVTIDRDYSGRKVGAETFGDCRSIKEIVFAKDCDDAVLDQFWEYFVVKSLNNTEALMKATTLYSLLKHCPNYALNNPEKAKKILKTVIAMTEQLGIGSITEGVETREQAEMLHSMGCNMFQGYYFSRPISLEEFEGKYLADRQPVA